MLDISEVVIAQQKARLKHQYGATQHKSVAPPLEQEPQRRPVMTMADALEVDRRERAKKAAAGGTNALD